MLQHNHDSQRNQNADQGKQENARVAEAADHGASQRANQEKGDVGKGRENAQRGAAVALLRPFRKVPAATGV